MDRRGDTSAVAVTVRCGGGAGGSIIAVATAVLSGAGNVAWSVTVGGATAGAVATAVPSGAGNVAWSVTVGGTAAGAVATAVFSGAGNAAWSVTVGGAAAGAGASAVVASGTGGAGMTSVTAGCGISGSGSATGSTADDLPGVVAPVVLPAGPNASSTPPLPAATAPDLGGTAAGHSQRTDSK